ncbi:hypothetical protein EVAR_53566_1, partial [Eumeta japonica]
MDLQRGGRERRRRVKKVAYIQLSIQEFTAFVVALRSVSERSVAQSPFIISQPPSISLSSLHQSTPFSIKYPIANLYFNPRGRKPTDVVILKSREFICSGDFLYSGGSQPRLPLDNAIKKITLPSMCLCATFCRLSQAGARVLGITTIHLIRFVADSRKRRAGGGGAPGHVTLHLTQSKSRRLNRIYTRRLTYWGSSFQENENLALPAFGAGVNVEGIARSRAAWPIHISYTLMTKFSELGATSTGARRPLCRFRVNEPSRAPTGYSFEARQNYDY